MSPRGAAALSRPLLLPVANPVFSLVLRMGGSMKILCRLLMDAYRLTKAVNRHVQQV